jgi:hypothetical protein
LSRQNLAHPSESAAAGNTKKRGRKQTNNLELLAPNIWLARQSKLHCHRQACHPRHDLRGRLAAMGVVYIAAVRVSLYNQTVDIHRYDSLKHRYQINDTNFTGRLCWRLQVFFVKNITSSSTTTISHQVRLTHCLRSV